MAARPAATFTNIVRRTATFEDGVFTGVLISRTRTIQLADFGNVTPQTVPVLSTADLMGTYVQTGNKLAMDLVFPNGMTLTTTWYVSKDGSVINGTLSTLRLDLGPFEFDLGDTRNWTLIENDTCDGEGFLTEPA